MNVKKLTLQRLGKEEAQLQRQPLTNALIVREEILKFYFCLHDLDGSYAGGFYFGLLELHQNYPFNAPKLIFYTPNGRFDLNLPICTSFTHYHQQSWTSAWNVRTLILGTISFMYSEQPSYGCCHVSHEERTKMARQSLQFNMQNQTFVRLFSDKLRQMGVIQNIVLNGLVQKEQVDCPAKQLVNDPTADKSDEQQQEIGSPGDNRLMVRSESSAQGIKQEELNIQKPNKKGKILNNILPIVGVLITASYIGYRIYGKFKGK